MSAILPKPPGDASPAGVKTLVSEPDWTCARAQNLFLLVWRGPATVQRARQVERLVREVTSSYAWVGVVAVVEPNAPTPDAAARPVFARAMRENGPRIRGTAYVVPASGFAGATIRAAITALSLMAREPYPTEVFASPDRASVWVAERLGDDWTEARVLAVVETVRKIA